MNLKIALIFLLIFVIIIFLLIILKTKRENFSNNKKLAFCFLIYDKINHEELWNNFLKNVDKNKYNIYIHYKTNKPLKYFEQYKIKNTIETKWCGDSLVEAQNIILKEAVNDSNNKHFIFVSDSCVPLKSFKYIYDKLDQRYSYFNKAIPYTKEFNKNIKAYKASQWCILNKNHTKKILDNHAKLKEIFKLFKKQHVRGCPDEYSYISLLYNLNLENELIETPNLSSDATTFTGWSDMKNYKNFSKSQKKGQPNNYSYICPEELDYLIKSKSLFGRKFAYNCKGLDKLSDKY